MIILYFHPQPQFIYMNYFVYTSHHMVFLSTAPSHPQHSIDVDSLKVDPPIPTLLWGGGTLRKFNNDFPFKNNASPFCQVSQVLSVLDCRYKAPDKVQLGLIEKFHFSGSFFFSMKYKAVYYIFSVSSGIEQVQLKKQMASRYV